MSYWSRWILHPPLFSWLSFILSLLASGANEVLHKSFASLWCWLLRIWSLSSPYNFMEHMMILFLYFSTQTISLYQLHSLSCLLYLPNLFTSRSLCNSLIINHLKTSKRLNASFNSSYITGILCLSSKSCPWLGIFPFSGASLGFEWLVEFWNCLRF